MIEARLDGTRLPALNGLDERRGDEGFRGRIVAGRGIRAPESPVWLPRNPASKRMSVLRSLPRRRPRQPAAIEVHRSLADSDHARIQRQNDPTNRISVLVEDLIGHYMAFC